MLKTGVIPQIYTHFINSISASDGAKDVVPYVVEEEEDISTIKTKNGNKEEITREKQRTK